MAFFEDNQSMIPEINRFDVTPRNRSRSMFDRLSVHVLGCDVHI